MTPYYYTDNNELSAGYIDNLPEMHARDVVCEWVDKILRRCIIDNAKSCFDDGGKYSYNLSCEIALIKYTDNQDSYYKIMLMGQTYLIDVSALPGAGLGDHEVLKLRHTNGRLDFVHGPHKYSHPDGKFSLIRASKPRIDVCVESSNGDKLYVVNNSTLHLFQDIGAVSDLVYLWWPWVVYHRHCVDAIKIAPVAENRDAFLSTPGIEGLLDLSYDVWYTHETTMHYKRFADCSWVSDDRSEVNASILEQLLQYVILTRCLIRNHDKDDTLYLRFDVHYRNGSDQAYRHINLWHHVC